MARNYYETLGLPMTAEITEIAASLDREFGQVSSLRLIPARQAEAEARGQVLHQIRQTLMNPTTRSKYDAYLSAVENDNRQQIGFAAPERISANPVPVPERTATVFCSSCGRPSRNGARFCGGCGVALESSPGGPTPVAFSAVSSKAGASGATSPFTPTRSSPQSQPPPPTVQNWSDVSMGATQGWSNGAAIPDTQPRNPGQSQPYSRATTPSWTGLSTYYQNEFQKIHDSGESYKGKWNWAAFLFGGIWALTKGVWLSVLICIVVSIVTGGIGGIVYWIIFAMRGNYMYYCAQTKGKQLLV